MTTENTIRSNWCTVEEAQTKFCPHMRVVAQEVTKLGKKASPPGNVFINDAGDITRIHCVADACMMWQWFDPAAYSELKPTGRCGLMRS